MLISPCGSGQFAVTQSKGASLTSQGGCFALLGCFCPGVLVPATEVKQGCHFFMESHTLGSSPGLQNTARAVVTQGHGEQDGVRTLPPLVITNHTALSWTQKS